MSYYSNKYNKEKFYLFWKETDEFSQWYNSKFKGTSKFDSLKRVIEFYNAEQWMMYNKALLFGDLDIAKKIIKTSDPKTIKKLGRKVCFYDQETWDENKKDIIKEGNMLKFGQNNNLLKLLLSIKGIIAEASPFDKVYGIGLNANDPKALDINTWEGENILGYTLMEVRDIFIKKLKSPSNNNICRLGRCKKPTSKGYDYCSKDHAMIGVNLSLCNNKNKGCNNTVGFDTKTNTIFKYCSLDCRNKYQLNNNNKKNQSNNILHNSYNTPKINYNNSSDYDKNKSNNILHNSYSTPKINYNTPKINYNTPKINYNTPKINYNTPKINYNNSDDYNKNKSNNTLLSSSDISTFNYIIPSINHNNLNNHNQNNLTQNIKSTNNNQFQNNSNIFNIDNQFKNDPNIISDNSLNTEENNALNNKLSTLDLY
jgi:hypothetical protein